ncbi:hypothetical protein IFM89_000347 [Coptis chinensis]|uniref:VQ domain-containing protein n=1 Tax=Coptis chinensis TaxID=261450 RepID=A0A835HBH5_9MAGN|nr:hypothetical protein IFM89_000347 [Coptis chinensis]
MYMFSYDENHKRVSPKRELQGPRPPALKLGQDSFKIKKPHASNQNRPPVVIHLKSPEIIHIRPQDFMNTVQRLTGKPKSLAPSATQSLLLSSSSSRSTSCYSNAHKYGSVGVMGDDSRNHEIQASTDFDKDRENLQVKEDLMMNVSHGISPSMQLNFSPMFPGSFLPSPNVYSNNWLEFGPIY